MGLMKCGAHNLEDHVCDGYPRPIYQRMMRTPCLNPAKQVKCLAESRRYGQVWPGPITLVLSLLQLTQTIHGTLRSIHATTVN